MTVEIMVARWMDFTKAVALGIPHFSVGGEFRCER